VYYTATLPGAIAGSRKLAVLDISSEIGTDVAVEHVTKRYSSINDGKSFYVDLTIRYDKRNPDYFTFTADIQAGGIPADAKISLAYGFDTYEDGSGNFRAITYPDLMKDGVYLNGSNTVEDQIFTTEEVQSLYMVGSRKTTGAQSYMGFFTMGGRPFDRAHSGEGTQGLPNICNYVFDTSIGPGVFNYYDTDNEIAVAYDNIPHATTISTGVTFMPSLPVGLAYAFQEGASFLTTPSQHITVPMNAEQAAQTTLRLNLRNGHSAAITGVGLQANMPTFPSGLTVTGTQTSQYFTGATHSHDDDYYKATGGTIAASATADILVPLSAASYGEWIIDYSNFSNMSNIMPMGSAPVVFTVTTEANYASTAPVTVPPGVSKTFTVKLPDPLLAHKDITVNLTYSAPNLLSEKPATMIIHQGTNFDTFTVTAADNATPGATTTITLTSTDYGAVIIGNNKTVTLTVGPKVYYIPVNPHLMSKMILVP
jgi:hypothetical protein